MTKRKKVILLCSSIATALIISGTTIWYFFSRPTDEPPTSATAVTSEMQSLDVTEASTNITASTTESTTIVTEITTGVATEAALTEAPPKESLIDKTIHLVKNESSENAAQKKTAKSEEPQTTSSPSTKSVKSEVSPSSSTETKPSTKPQNTQPSSQSLPKAKEKPKVETKPDHNSEKASEPAQKAEKVTECNHTWVWKTKIQTIHHDAETHQEPVYDYDDGHFEYVEHEWVQCNHCLSKFKTHADYKAHPCYPQCTWSTIYTSDETYYPPQIIDYKTVLDKKAYDEEVEENDYQYCSICGRKK